MGRHTQLGQLAENKENGYFPWVAWCLFSCLERKVKIKNGKMRPRRACIIENWTKTCLTALLQLVYIYIYSFSARDDSLQDHPKREEGDGKLFQPPPPPLTSTSDPTQVPPMASSDPSLHPTLLWGWIHLWCLSTWWPWFYLPLPHLPLWPSCWMCFSAWNSDTWRSSTPTYSLLLRIQRGRQHLHLWCLPWQCPRRLLDLLLQELWLWDSFGLRYSWSKSSGRRRRRNRRIFHGWSWKSIKTASTSNAIGSTKCREYNWCSTDVVQTNLRGFKPLIIVSYYYIWVDLWISFMLCSVWNDMLWLQFVWLFLY